MGITILSECPRQDFHTSIFPPSIWWNTFTPNLIYHSRHSENIGRQKIDNVRHAPHLPLRSPTNPTKKEEIMPPIEKMDTDRDQYMSTVGWGSPSVALSEWDTFCRTPKARPYCRSMTYGAPRKRNVYSNWLWDQLCDCFFTNYTKEPLDLKDYKCSLMYLLYGTKAYLLNVFTVCFYNYIHF